MQKTRAGPVGDNFRKLRNAATADIANRAAALKNPTRFWSNRAFIKPNKSAK